MAKQSDNFIAKTKINCALRNLILCKLNSLEKDENFKNDTKAQFGITDLDTLLITIPDNTADTCNYTIPADSTIDITGSSKMLNQSIKKRICNPDICSEKYFNITEDPHTIYTAIEQTLNSIIIPEQSALATKCKILHTGTSSITPNTLTALFVILHGNTAIYKSFVEFLLSILLRQVHTAQELACENMDSLLEHMKENWILLGSYVNQYLKENNLPSADFITELSSMPYEGRNSEARIYFSNNSLRTVTRFDPTIGADSRILCRNHLRPIRKLIELSKRKVVYLYAEPTNNAHMITQLVQLREDYCDDPIESNTAKKLPTDTYIKFSGFMHWSVVCGIKEVFSYYHGHYVLNTSSKNARYKADIENLQNIDDNTKKMIENLVEALKKQEHGTSVILSVFSDDSKIEKYIDNLCKKNYGIKLCSDIQYDPSKGWDEGLLLSLTDIDGALFIDFEKKFLVTIGTLVYDKITTQGDTGRGSRYNSIHNYVKTKKDGVYIGIVISEHGMIDIFQNDASKKKK